MSFNYHIKKACRLAKPGIHENKNKFQLCACGMAASALPGPQIHKLEPVTNTSL